ncbi:hypothetical protein ACJX0J_010388, partial [Zea mays]
WIIYNIEWGGNSSILMTHLSKKYEKKMNQDIVKFKYLPHGVHKHMIFDILPTASVPGATIESLLLVQEIIENIYLSTRTDEYISVHENAGFPFHGMLCCQNRSFFIHVNLKNLQNLHNYFGTTTFWTYITLIAAILEPSAKLKLTIEGLQTRMFYILWILTTLAPEIDHLAT